MEAVGGDCFVELLRRQWKNGPLILLSGTSDKKVQEGGDKEVFRLGGLDLEEREGPTDPGTNFCAALCGLLLHPSSATPGCSA